MGARGPIAFSCVSRICGNAWTQRNSPREQDRGLPASKQRGCVFFYLCRFYGKCSFGQGEGIVRGELMKPTCLGLQIRDVREDQGAVRRGEFEIPCLRDPIGGMLGEFGVPGIQRIGH